MSDKVLLDEARKCAPGDEATGLAVMVHRLADALEARQPSEDANGATSAVLNRLDELNNGGISYEVYSELHDLVSAIPAAVPDAATERFEKAEHDRLHWRRRFQTMHKRAIRAETERDAALAAIGRVREAVENHKHWNDDCGWDVPTIEVLAALDGAPEPKVKP